MKRKALKIVGALVAFSVVLLLVGVFWVRRVTESRWTRFQREMSLRLETERTRDFGRSPLRGSGSPGNAWDDYTAAIAEVKKIPDRGKLWDLVQRRPTADAAWGAAAVERSEAVLNPLMRAATRWVSSAPYERELGLSMKLPDVGEGAHIVHLAILKARSQLESGRSGEAVGTLLDAAQFGRDLADDGPLISEMVGLAMLAPTLDALRELAASEKADAAALAGLDRGLAMLESGFPRHAACLRREQLAIGMTFTRMEIQELLGMPIRGFPDRMLCLNAWDRFQDALEQSAQACDGPWAESVATSQRLESKHQKSWNPILRLLSSYRPATERVVRERLAQLRLLRIALRYRRTGERPALADPFGTMLRSAASREGLKLWSVGADGVDDGGSGEWSPKAGGDIVLEVRR